MGMFVSFPLRQGHIAISESTFSCAEMANYAYY